MLQLVLTGVLYLILVIPVGRYLYHIAAGSTPSPTRYWTGSTA